MNRNLILIGGLILIVLLGGFWFIRSQGSDQTGPSYNQTSSPSQNSYQTSEKPATDGAMVAGEAQEFVISGSNFKYDLLEIKVKKGTKVSIVFKSSEGLHDLIVDGYDVATKKLQSGESESVSFIADKAGTFEYYCSVGNHRQMGMKGNLIVE